MSSASRIDRNRPTSPRELEEPPDGGPEDSTFCHNAELLRYEHSLRNGGLEEAVRYETQGLEPGLVAGILIGLATEHHPNMPISNSYLIHELAEAKAFREKGFDFSSEEILRLSYEEKCDLAENRRRMYLNDREPHLAGIRSQCEYLRTVAAVQGYELHLGVMLQMCPLLPQREVAEVFARSNLYVVVPGEQALAIKFYTDLLLAEPRWHDFMREVHARCPIRFFDVLEDS